MKKVPHKQLLKTCLFAALVAFSLSACNDDDDDDAPIDPVVKTIPAVAAADPQFSTLVAALTKAELAGTLQGTGPYTVFAPNNAAFTKAGVTSLDGLSKDALTPILTSHVLNGTVKAADVKSGTAKTLNADNDIYLSKNADGVFINGNIKVVSTDVAADNGVIHVIDNVIMPPSKTLVQVAQGDTTFSELVSLVLAADPAVATSLGSAASGLTVFAPTNAAFREVYKTTPKAALIANKTLLTNVLLYHVIPSRVFSTDLPNVTGPVTTANTSGTLTFNLSGGAKVVGKSSGASNITAANILATNGVVHVIDKVLMP
ncbi:MAG: fasciclin domain-containing protein [Dyadobacter fermentans]